MKVNMKRLFLAALAAISLATCVHAQSSASGPLVTPSGELQFVRVDRDFVAMLDKEIFDRFGANTLTHFDDVGNANDTVTRTLVQTDSGQCCTTFVIIRRVCFARASAWWSSACSGKAMKS
ncbi:hypothetical protein LMG28138_05257 [Pararobbsia alpina]|uniref:Uncharacterized protein n=1 Tax=Pararobbsia alpina TaxID=621374 RepID=A0A6S7BKD9_9BURK|nr:hypothetical protein LMG28138_05257 [Pararobbsia alpina]